MHVRRKATRIETNLRENRFWSEKCDLRLVVNACLVYKSGTAGMCNVLVHSLAHTSMRKGQEYFLIFFVFLECGATYALPEVWCMDQRTPPRLFVNQVRCESASVHGVGVILAQVSNPAEGCNCFSRTNHIAVRVVLRTYAWTVNHACP